MTELDSGSAYLVGIDLGYNQSLYTLDEFFINFGVSFNTGFQKNKLVYRFDGSSEYLITESCNKLGITPLNAQAQLNESPANSSIRDRLAAILASRKK